MNRSSHSCIPQPANTCPPGQPCVQTLKLPTCVPDQCLACRPDQFCRKVGSVCSEQAQEQRTEGSGGSNLLQAALLSVYPELRQFQPPPPCVDMYQCAQKDNCGGCPIGQRCEMTGIVCMAGPCSASFRCVTSVPPLVDPCGGCAEGYQCLPVVGRAAACSSLSCRTHTCVPTSAMD
ncbi:hypothetical protein ElyMa_002443600 [Elysia marginata]|uniref:IGFBP N-terminal domain-containing protein n=1 Tax=Elysia marginata TaxID=1093978 RepID=A0AAV4GII0_9GAST|nr:hypothetical protein ElyMa_002443600 [Elysia marginata]